LLLVAVFGGTGLQPVRFCGRTTLTKTGNKVTFALAKDSQVAQTLSIFRMSTYENVSKQITLTPFRMNTYAKTRGRGQASVRWLQH
jgi:hypothetical protein